MTPSRHYDKHTIMQRMRKQRTDSHAQREKEHRSVGILLYVFVSIAALLFLFLMVAVFTG